MRRMEEDEVDPVVGSLEIDAMGTSEKRAKRAKCSWSPLLLTGSASGGSAMVAKVKVEEEDKLEGLADVLMYTDG